MLLRMFTEQMNVGKLYYLLVNSCMSLVTYICPTVVLISSYGAPLAQRASYLALHSSVFGPRRHSELGLCCD